MCTFNFDKHSESAPPTDVIPLHTSTSSACNGLFPQTLAKQDVSQHFDLYQSDRENAVSS